MKQSRIVLGLFALMIAFTISSCGDDDDPTSSKSKTELLTQNTWKFSSASSSDADVTSFYNAFYTNSELKFKTDKTYTESSIFGDESGVWEFANNESSIILDKGTSDEETWPITKLTESNFEYTTDDGIVVTLKFVKK